MIVILLTNSIIKKFDLTTRLLIDNMDFSGATIMKPYNFVYFTLSEGNIMNNIVENLVFNRIESHCMVYILPISFSGTNLLLF